MSGGLYGLDLFSGIGGITRALTGYVQPVAYCEIDDYCRGLLLSRMASGDIPFAPIWDDVKTLASAMLPAPIEIIYGGFPCQDISIAGHGEGLAGKRSGLFFEIVRLAKEIRPSFIFLENVPNIRTKGLDRVIYELAEIGYDCRWDTLSAADVGANHKRERWFMLAYSNRADGGLQPIQRNKCEETTISRADGTSQRMANTVCKRLERYVQSEVKLTQSHREPAGGWWAAEPNVGRVAYGVSKRVDRLRALGNAVVPAQAREAFERLVGLK